MIWKQEFNFNRNEWISGRFHIAEMKKFNDRTEYFCYKDSNYIGFRLTPEEAKEYCESKNGNE